MKSSTTTARPFVSAPQREVDAHRAATRLRNLLRSNGLFSTATGLVAAVAAGPVAELLEIDQVWVVRFLGVSLVVFAGLVTSVTRIMSHWNLLE